MAVVSQELNLVPDLDVLANLFTKREPRRELPRRPAAARPAASRPAGRERARVRVRQPGVRTIGFRQAMESSPMPGESPNLWS